jgi:hypothetical protein
MEFYVQDVGLYVHDVPSHWGISFDRVLGRGLCKLQIFREHPGLDLFIKSTNCLTMPLGWRELDGRPEPRPARPPPPWLW